MLRRLLDLWIARYASPSQEALQAVAHLMPVTVVTGGSRGIGLALARRFAEAGHDVVLVARNVGPLQEAATQIARDFSVKAFPMTLDVTQADAPRKLDEYLAAHGLYLDVLVNNAGVGLAGPFAAHDEADVMHLLDLNIAALTRLMHHALTGMQARARGGILNVASLGGLAPGPYQAAYYASKAYVISLTEAVGYETAGAGVRTLGAGPRPGGHELSRSDGRGALVLSSADLSAEPGSDGARRLPRLPSGLPPHRPGSDEQSVGGSAAPLAAHIAHAADRLAVAPARGTALGRDPRQQRLKCTGVPSLPL